MIVRFVVIVSPILRFSLSPPSHLLSAPPLIPSISPFFRFTDSPFLSFQAVSPFLSFHPFPYLHPQTSPLYSTKLIPFLKPIREDQHGLFGIKPHSRLEMWGFLFSNIEKRIICAHFSGSIKDNVIHFVIPGRTPESSASLSRLERGCVRRNIDL